MNAPHLREEYSKCKVRGQEKKKPSERARVWVLGGEVSRTVEYTAVNIVILLSQSDFKYFFVLAVKYMYGTT